jgi:hypothetical protein
VAGELESLFFCSNILRLISVVVVVEVDAPHVRAVRICLSCHPSRINRKTSR